LDRFLGGRRDSQEPGQEWQKGNESHEGAPALSVVAYIRRPYFFFKCLYG
jgi:hypothetical protein